MGDARYFLMLGAVLAGLAVGFGAFGAHGLQQHFGQKYRDSEPKEVAGVPIPASQKYYDDYRTGVAYHFWHALGLIAVGLLALHRPHPGLSVAGWSFVLGTLLFSGGLYVLTIGGPRWLGVPWGAVVPLGGVLFLVGWIAFAVAACPCMGSPAERPPSNASR